MTEHEIDAALDRITRATALSDDADKGDEVQAAAKAEAILDGVAAVVSLVKMVLLTMQRIDDSLASVAESLKKATSE